MKGLVSLRSTAWLVAVALVVLPLVGLVRGWFASGRWPIRYLKVEAPYRHVSADQLRAVVKPFLHKGFFATRLDRVQQAVVAMPWVASAEARKVWPDTLVLRVYERNPVAHWNGDELIGRDGSVFHAPGARKLKALPELSGPDAREPDVLAFYRKVSQQCAGVGLKVRGVDLSGRDSWRVQLDGGAELVIGNVEPEQRLERFLETYPRLIQDGGGEHFSRVDLRYANGFAVRWVQPGASGGVPKT
jgi:cell division protein FtsQ